MLAVSMPNPATSLALVDSATKCRATASLPARSLSSSQLRAERALVRVSWVVNVLDATMNSVRSGSRSATVSARWVPSTLDTKWARIPGFQYGLSASVTITGPRSEPPIPMLTTSVIDLPVWPFHAPLRTRSVKSRIFASTALTWGMTSAPSTRIGRFERLRSATCSTARCSVTLILSPENIRSRQPATSACSASASSSRQVSSVARCLDQSTSRPQTSRDIRRNRRGSAANSSRIAVAASDD
jgi:hypothetical protein